MTCRTATMKFSRKRTNCENMMGSSDVFVIIFFCLMTVASATFFITPAKGNDNASNICIYSADPTKYAPKCFVCLDAVYPNALQACVNATTMPSNISYSQANCVERNCAINFPKPAPVQKPSLSSLPSKLGPFIGLLKQINDKIHKRSISNDNDPPDSNRIDLIPYAGEGDNKMLLQLDKMENIRMTQQIETYASEQIIAENEDEDDSDRTIDDDYY